MWVSCVCVAMYVHKTKPYSYWGLGYLRVYVYLTIHKVYELVKLCN